MNWSHFLRTALAAAGFLAVGALRADVFEGKVEMKVAAGKDLREKATIDYAIKAPKVRMQVGGGKKDEKATMIFDYKQKVLYILMEDDGEKMFMKQPIPDTAEKAGKGDKEIDEIPQPTGRTEKILGYEASEYVINHKDKTSTQIWFAAGLGNFLGDFASTGPGKGKGSDTKIPPALEKLAREKGLFPVRVIGLDAKGKETSRMEVTKIEPGKVPDALFSTEGYKEFSIPGMGGMPWGK